MILQADPGARLSSRRRGNPTVSSLSTNVLKRFEERFALEREADGSGFLGQKLLLVPR